MKNFEALRKDWNSFKTGGGSGAIALDAIPLVYLTEGADETWLSPAGEPDRKLTPQDLFDLYGGEMAFHFSGHLRVLILSDTTVPDYYKGAAPSDLGDMRAYQVEILGRNETGFSLVADFAGWTFNASSASDYFLLAAPL